MILHLDFNHREAMIDTQYGFITHLSWLQKEQGRIEKDPLRYATIQSLPGDQNIVGLFVNEVKGCQCKDCKRVFKESKKAFGKPKL